MSAKELLFKYKPLIIIILLFLLVFSIRAEAANIGGVPDQMKSYYQDQSGLPYFSEMDSYYNFRLTQDLVSHGYLGDTKINGTQWDIHSSFPQGQSAEYPPLIAIVTEIGYKFINLFSHVSLAGVAFWMGAFIASLAVIPAYLLVRRITNDYGGITAGLLVGLAPAYFSHTFAGFFDTDMFSMLIPLLIVYFFVLSILASDMKKRTIYAVLSAISMLLFTVAWQGWWFIFYLVIGSSVIYLLISKYLLKLKLIKSSENITGRLAWFNDKPEIFTLVVFLVLSLILMAISLGVSGLFNALLEPIQVSHLQSAVQATSYPNVYVSVSELQIPSIVDIINGVGGYLPFFFGIFGVIALIWKVKTKEDKKEVPDKKPRKPRRRGRNRKQVEETVTVEDKAPKTDLLLQKSNYIFYIVLFTLWLLITTYAMTKGVRFIENFSLPIALSAGIFVGFLFGYVKDHVSNHSYQKIIMAIIVIVVAFSPVASAYGISSSVVPGTDDSMVSSLQWIGNSTANNTVITSWWDYGHLFTDVANRPVTFDGSSQNSPRAYWVGKALLTSNETLSVGILRMLASNGDLAPLTLDNYTKNSGTSAEILNNILGVDKTTAISIMTTQYNLTQQQAQTVVQYTHPDNPTPDVLITSSDMVGKAGWWSYFGSWNFTSANGTNYQYLASQLNATTINNKTLLLGGNAVVAQPNGTSFSTGIVNTNAIKTNDSTAILNQISDELTTGNGTLVIKPHTLTVINNTTITQTVVSNSSQYSILLINENNTYIGVAMNRELENSMFTKLFFEGGAGLTHFKAAYGQPGVMVWNVTY
jgi:dolichyl-diphosphooligosaccharide--protein glycosyltransferase